MSLKEQLHPIWIDLLGEKIELLNAIEDLLHAESYLPSKENVLRALSYDPETPRS